MTLRNHVRETFPAVDSIEDDSLRSGVLDAWVLGMEETGTADLATIPWYLPVQKRLNLPDEALVDHVRNVTAIAHRIAPTVDAIGPSVSTDLVIAGALVHDVSKVYEFDGFEESEVRRLVGHPAFGVYVVERVGLPREIAHIVVSHTPKSGVDPAFIEADIVRRADELAVNAVRATVLSDLRE